MNTEQSSIYKQKSQLLKDVFDSVPAEKVMLVALDYAKTSFVGRPISGTGQLLTKRPWKIYNSRDGVDFLWKKIQSLCRKHHIAQEHVLLGGENLPKYTVNFIHALRQMGLKFVHSNAVQCSKNGGNRRAKSDPLDLRPISVTILDREARDVRAFNEQALTLREATRFRRQMVESRSTHMNRMHGLVNILCPGFLSKKTSGISPFSEASLWLMEDDMSLERLQRRRESTLAQRLEERGVDDPAQSAQRLKEFARRALPPPVDQVAYLSQALKDAVGIYQSFCQAVDSQENSMARLLIQMPGFYFTSIPGIGLVRTSEMVGEVGDNWFKLRPGNILSYGGLVPGQTQSGDGEVVKLKLPRHANKTLKNAILQSAHGTAAVRHPARRVDPNLGEHRLRAHYRSVALRGGKTGLSTANLLVRICHKLINEQRIYLPDKGTKYDVNAYFACVERMLQHKWKDYDLRGIPEEDNRLIKLRKDIEQAKDLPNQLPPS
jgi:transposase